MSVRRIMDWDLVKPYSGVSLGKIGAYEAYTVRHGRCVLGLHPGLVRTEYLKEETPQLRATFLRQFLEAGVTSLLNFVQPAGFILLTSTGSVEWSGLSWQNLVTFCYRLGCMRLSEQFNTAFRKACNTLYTILERYNPEAWTFFTPWGKWNSPFMRCMKSRG